jgi:hypothetical protein
MWGHLTLIPPRTGTTGVPIGGWLTLSRAAGFSSVATSTRLAQPSCYRVVVPVMLKLTTLVLGFSVAV